MKIILVQMMKTTRTLLAGADPLLDLADPVLCNELGVVNTERSTCAFWSRELSGRVTLDSDNSNTHDSEAVIQIGLVYQS